MSCENWCHCLCWMANYCRNTYHHCIKNVLNTDFIFFSLSFKFYVKWDPSFKRYQSVTLPPVITLKLKLSTYHVKWKVLHYFCLHQPHIFQIQEFLGYFQCYEIDFYHFPFEEEKLSVRNFPAVVANQILGYEKSFMQLGEKWKAFFFSS